MAAPTRRSKGTCSNAATIGRRELEARIFDGLKTRLMAPELVREFVDSLPEGGEQGSGGATSRRPRQRAARLDAVERKIAALVAAIEDGSYSPALGDRLAALESEKANLQVEIAPSPRPSCGSIPALADIYAAKVARLEEALNDPAIRDEANEMLRSLIERVELRPGDEGEPMQAVLVGDLARILAICEAAARNKKPPRGESRGRVQSVGGCGDRI